MQSPKKIHTLALHQSPYEQYFEIMESQIKNRYPIKIPSKIVDGTFHEVVVWSTLNSVWLKHAPLEKEYSFMALQELVKPLSW